jgi:VanZ family protein
MVAATSIPNLDTSNWPNADKVFHFAVYAVWAILCLRTVKLAGWGGAAVWMIVAAAGLAVGAADELHEKIIPGRTVSLPDFLYNAAGFMTGMVMGNIRFFKKAGEQAS